MNQKSWLVFPAILLVLLGVFLLLDVRLMSSRTITGSTTAASHNSDFSAGRDLSPAVTGLYVEGQGAVAELLPAQIKTLLQNQKSIGQMTIVNAPADRMDIPVLYVEVSPVKHIWTPLYALAEYQLTASYASTGDTSFRKDPVTHFQSSGDSPYLQFKATTTLTDASFGIISSPGYEHYLADRLAEQVNQSLQAQLKD